MAAVDRREAPPASVLGPTRAPASDLGPTRDGQGPPDLGPFWAMTVATLAQIPPDVRRVTRSSPSASIRTYDLSFASWGHRRVRGYAMVWDDGAARPLIVHAHGYRSHVQPRPEWVRAGCHVVGFDVRGFGRSTDAVTHPARAGWLLTGARQPETSVLRGAVATTSAPPRSRQRSAFASAAV